MENNSAGFLGFLPFLILMVPLVIVCRRLAKDKGRSITKYTILGCLPIVNYFAVIYLVGTTNRVLEDKLEQILSIIKTDKFSDENQNNTM